jgi:hypothetical protein
MLQLTKEQNLVAALEGLIEKIKKGEASVVDLEQRNTESEIVRTVGGSHFHSQNITITQYSFSIRYKIKNPT